MKPTNAVMTTAWAAAFALMAVSTATAQMDDSVQKYGQEFKGKISRTYAESQEWYPEAKKAKPGTPNVLIILLDDVGYSQIGCYGGLIQTPNIDAMAADGLRYNNSPATTVSRRKAQNPLSTIFTTPDLRLTRLENGTTRL